jgi:hypothetical protein
MPQCLIKKFRNEMQRNVKKYGCSVVGIQGGGLSYVYSVGIGKSFGAPEVIVWMRKVSAGGGGLGCLGRHH